MDLEMNDRACVVTGATAGIGYGVSLCLAAEGARVVAVARRQSLLDRLAAEFEKRNYAAPICLSLDVTGQDAPVQIRDAALEAFGRIDVLVNNAGQSRSIGPLADDDVWDDAMALNFNAGRRVAQALLSQMIEQQYGRIVNVTGSSEPASTNAATTANGAVYAWAKGLSRDVARHGVTVNSVGPGRILSEQIVERVHPTEEARRAFADANIPAGYFGEPEDAGRLVAFLASPAARYITGQIILVDGGMSRFAY